jgi:hypothetical protein
MVAILVGGILAALAIVTIGTWVTFSMLSGAFDHTVDDFATRLPTIIQTYLPKSTPTPIQID